MTINGETIYEYPMKLIDSSGNQLTVYSGELDVTNNKVIVTQDIVKVNQCAGVTNGKFYITLTSRFKRSVNAICDQLALQSVTYTSLTAGHFGVTGGTGTNIYFVISDDITTTADMNTYLADNPLTFIVDLATPETYKLAG